MANTPPVANDDTASVASGAYVDIDVFANDTDADAFDVFGLPEYTPAVDEHGNEVGRIEVVFLPSGRVGLRFYADDPSFDTGAHTITFQYIVRDSWYEGSNPATVTVTVTGNAVQGQTINGLNHPQTFTPTSNDPRILYQLKGNDVLNGGNQHDTIDGGLGADTIHGNNGTDRLFGGAGNDKIYGDNGSDTLTGGSGNDTLTGGNSPDHFRFAAGSGDDVITDYDVKTDKIVLDSSFAGSYGGLFSLGLVTSENGGVRITSVDGDDSIFLEGVKLSSLRESGFIFEF
ncbi:calcium-binding protein [Phenylobacterium sp.]|jgi:hypothetical protein|uniref:calcium-binding protein n=1 Tax=Phenylobacterium sp. TaxID=1871053 RepID=UPI002F955596